MAKIIEYLKKIKSARRGLDVRDSIHDSIEAMNNQIENELGGMIENGNTVINNMQEEIQSVQDMKANGDLLMKPSDLTQEHWDKIKTDVTYYYKRYESTYTTVEENESNIPINISKYNEGSILEVYIEGRMLTREEYVINGTNSITLTTALSEIGTKVHFIVYRSVCAVNEDFDKLKGDTGEIGTPIPYDGTFNQLKSDDVDKLYNYIILDSSDTEYSGHWVYYDRYTSEWKDGGLYLSHQLTTEIKNELNEIITNISNVKEELEAETERVRKDLNALPSRPASGEYIHVEDSAESRFKSFKIGGNSKQETRQGYNLLDMRNAVSYPDSGITCTVKEDGSYSYVGTATNEAINVWLRGGYYSEITEENTLFVLEADTYYIKDVVLFSGTRKIETINKIVTLTKDTPITGIRAPSATIGATYNEIKYPIVAKSDVAVEWEQYGATPSLEFPSEVQAVKDSANVTIQNENYYDKSKAHADGANKQNIMIDKIQGLEVGENYTAYANGKGWLAIREVDKEKNVIAKYGNVASTTIINFTKKSNSNDINMEFYSGGNNVDVSTYDFTNVMVVKGKYTNASQLPTYVPHKSKTFTIPVQQEMLKIGDYADTFIKKDGIWYERHFIKKLTLTGNEDWQINGNTFVVYNIGKNNNNYKGYSNYFKYKVDWDNNENRIFVYDTTLVMSQANFDFSDIDSLKALLKEKYENGTPLVVYYASKEKDLECTTEQKAVLDEIKKTAQSYKNITNIYSTDELSPVFEVEYRKKIESLTGTADSVDWSNVQNKPDLVAITDEEIDNIINY